MKPYTQQNPILDYDTLDVVSESICVINPDFHVLHINPAFRRLMRFGDLDVRGVRLREFVAMRQSEQFEAEARECIRKQKVRFETRLQRHDGHLIDVEVSSTPFKDSRGRLCGAVLTIRNVTSRIGAERDLEQQLRFEQVLLDSIPIPVFFKDRNGMYLGCNNAMEKLTGIPRDQIIGSTANDFPELQELLEQAQISDRKIFEGEGIQTYEADIQTAKNDHTLRICKASFRDADGRIAGLIGAVLDITDHRAEGDRLRDEYEQLLAVLDASPIPAFVIDCDYVVQFWNTACELLTGVSRKRVLGKTVDSKIFYTEQKQRPVLAELVLQDDIERITELYQGKRLAGSDIIEGAYEATDSLFSGEKEKPIYFIAAKIRNNDGDVVGAIETLQDITERKEAQEKILQYQEKLRDLSSQLVVAEERERRRIAVALHDSVSQNLAGTKLKLQLLEQDLKRQENRELVSQSIKLLDEASHRTRTLTFELCPPMLHELGLSAAMEWLCEQFESMHDVSCTLSKDGSDKPLSQDLRAMLFRCVRELMMNSIKHGKAGNIHVTSRQNDGNIEIVVSDDGAGFDARQPNPHDTSGGFGLFSIRERLSCLGGSLRVKSTAGAGCEATIRAPLQ